VFFKKFRIPPEVKKALPWTPYIQDGSPLKWQKNILYRFFFHLKLQNFENVGLFIPQGLCPECILLKNANVIDVGRGLR
jgi:hypothetical protein